MTVYVLVRGEVPQVFASPKLAKAALEAQAGRGFRLVEGRFVRTEHGPAKGMYTTTILGELHACEVQGDDGG